MADLRIAPGPIGPAITMDLLLAPGGFIDETHELASAALVAIGSDRRALADDILPDVASDDLRGWWGDTDAETIWGGWHIGSRLWLLSRAKITDSGYRGGATLTNVEAYIREAFAPWLTARIATAIDVVASRLDSQTIVAALTIYRGNASVLAMQYQLLWNDI